MSSTSNSLRSLTLALALGLVGCQTVAPASGPYARGQPKTLCEAPSLRVQCAAVDAATHWKRGVVVGNSMVISPLARWLADPVSLAMVGSSAEVAGVVRVLEAPVNIPLVIVDPDEKFRVAVLRAALVKVKLPIVPRDVAIMVKDPDQYADLKAQAAQLGLYLLLAPASQP